MTISKNFNLDFWLFANFLPEHFALSLLVPKGLYLVYVELQKIIQRYFHDQF